MVWYIVFSYGVIGANFLKEKQITLTQAQIGILKRYNILLHLHKFTKFDFNRIVRYRIFQDGNRVISRFGDNFWSSRSLDSSVFYFIWDDNDDVYCLEFHIHIKLEKLLIVK